MAGTLACLPIEGNLWPQILDALIEQMSEQMAAGLTGPFEGARVSRGRNPGGKFALNRRRIGADLDRPTGAALSIDRLASP